MQQDIDGVKGRSVRPEDPPLQPMQRRRQGIVFDAFRSGPDCPQRLPHASIFRTHQPVRGDPRLVVPDEAAVYDRDVNDDGGTENDEETADGI